MSTRLNIPTKQIHRFCQRWDVVEFALFGSAARGELTPASDVDVLISFAEHARPTLLDIARMGRELQALFGRPVDLVTKQSIEHTANPIRRQTILEGMEMIYAA